MCKGNIFPIKYQIYSKKYDNFFVFFLIAIRLTENRLSCQSICVIPSDVPVKLCRAAFPV